MKYNLSDPKSKSNCYSRHHLCQSVNDVFCGLFLKCSNLDLKTKFNNMLETAKSQTLIDFVLYFYVNCFGILKYFVYRRIC